HTRALTSHSETTTGASSLPFYFVPRTSFMLLIAPSIYVLTLSEAVFVCGEGADVGHSEISVRWNKVRAHRVLVVIRPAGDGLAAPLAVETQWRAGRRKEFVPRGMHRTQ
ncbi:hypothetical protein KDX06_32735, partial [Burkholderia vietnamiensis]|nr:hypothetical protein [Burkholderia vietnamiensis]